jgi:hypothetical protein
MKTVISGDRRSPYAHPDENRTFSVAECLRLQGFPADWQLVGSVRDKFLQLGNAAPVPLAYAAAMSAKAALPNHAFLSPSAASRWLTCNAAPYREAGYPDTSSEAAKIGTAAHELLERAMKKPHAKLSGAVSKIAENGHTFTAEMCDHIDRVRAAITAEYPGARWLIEKKVPIGEAFGCADLLWGTADLIGSLGNRLIIADLKYGKHAVSPENNTQLLLYAIGVAYKTGWRHEFIDLVILQPRTGKLLKKASYTLKALKMVKGLYALQIKNVLAANAESTAVPGNHCYFCKASNDCSEKRAAEASKQFAEFL